MSWLSALGIGRDKNKGKTADQAEMHFCDYRAVTDRGEQVGSIHDYVMDANGKLRYVIVMLEEGMAAGNKQVSVPVGMIQIDDNREEVVLIGMTSDRINSMPAYDERQGFSDDYERNLMSTYYPNQQHQKTPQGNIDYDRYREFKTPERIRLLEERLQVNKHTQKMGDVTVSKHVETRQESVEVPINREHLVIERHPADQTTAQTGDMTMKEDTVTIPLYTEEVDVTKRPVVAEEVTIRKESTTETRTVSENVGRERLDVDDPQHIAEAGASPGSQRGIPANERENKNPAGKREVKVDVIPTDKTDNR